MLNIKERKTKIWNGNYKGVSFEINNFKTPKNDWDDEKSNWTYYLFIHLNRIPNKDISDSFWIKGTPDNKGRVFYRYNDHHIINNIDLSGGCTWYSKEAGFDNSNKVIKIGCDYQHIWNDGIEYYLEWIINDVKKSIDSFLSFIPDYKCYCVGNGNLYLLNEGVIKDGYFHSKEYFGQKEWFIEYEKSIKESTEL